MTKESKNEFSPQVELTDKEVREKLVIRGVEAMSDVELLSVLLHQGSSSTRSLELARRVERETGGELMRLSQMELPQLRMLGSMGIRRAAVVASALELGRRVVREESTTIRTIVTNNDVVELFRPHIAELKYEEFWVLYLSSANTVLDKVRVSKGGVSGTVVDKRIVVRRALELLASSLILVHNHPSGVAKPSGDDESLTAGIVESAGLFDIAVLDHLIITTGECYSFRKEGFPLSANSLK